MTVERWPWDWAERRAGKGCPMCVEGRSEENRFGARIFAGGYGDAYLQRIGSPRGYTIVIWSGRHVAEPTELSEAEAAGYWLETLTVGRALERQYQPAKVNYQMLGNAVPHLHTHILPRYLDDGAPGRPLPFPDAEQPHLAPDLFAEQLSVLRRLLGHAPEPAARPRNRT